MRVRKRPDFVTGFTQKVQTGLGGMYLTVNEVDGKPFEIFATIGKSGHSVTAKAEAIGRLVSLAFRSGIDVADVVGQLKGIGGEHPIFQKKGLLLSIPDAIAWVLENRYLKGRNPVPTHPFGLRPSALPRLRRRARFSGRLPSLPQLRLHQVRRADVGKEKIGGGGEGFLEKVLPPPPNLPHPSQRLSTLSEPLLSFFSPEQGERPSENQTKKAD